MELPAFRLTQKASDNTTSFFIATIPAIELVERHKLDRWTPGNARGYQRLPQEGRFIPRSGSIVRYLTQDMGCFPTSILVNVRGSLTYTMEQDLGWASIGKLEIDEKEKLWLLDGQHRVEALHRVMEEKIMFREYPVAISILHLPNRFEELMYFYIVNRKQKMVPLDLVYRHLQLMLKERGENWLQEFEGKKGLYRGKAAEIVDMLNDNPRSAWKGRIRQVTEVRRDEHVVRDKTMIKLIADILGTKVCARLTNEEAADLLVDYWNSINRLYPGAFADPRAYTLLGDQGVTSLHMLFPAIYGICMEGGIVTEERMTEILSKLRKETPDHSNPVFKAPIPLGHWSRDEGLLEFTKTDRASIRELYRNLLEKITVQETRPSRALPGPR
jgi:DGQHR domain-containing protein